MSALKKEYDYLEVYKNLYLFGKVDPRFLLYRVKVDTVFTQIGDDKTQTYHQTRDVYRRKYGEKMSIKMCWRPEEYNAHGRIVI